MLKMIHPEVESVASVVDSDVFNAVWAPRGWELLAEPESVATELLGVPVKRLEDLKVDELKALVAARGREYPASVRKKDDAAKLFRDTFVVENAVPLAELLSSADGGSPDPVNTGDTNTNQDK